MQHSHRSRLRVGLLAAAVSGLLILGQPRHASAYGGEGLAVAAAVYVTYLTVMSIPCASIAAIKASDYPGGFTGAFEDCLRLELKEQSSSLAENDQSDRSPKAEQDEIKDRDD